MAEGDIDCFIVNNFKKTFTILEKPSAPGMPEILNIGKDTATLRWSKPSNDGGAPIINYRIEMKTIGTYRWDHANPHDKITDNKHTITGLHPETDYEFRVLAENKAGVSVPSSESRTAKYGEWEYDGMNAFKS